MSVQLSGGGRSRASFVRGVWSGLAAEMLPRRKTYQVCARLTRYRIPTERGLGGLLCRGPAETVYPTMP